MSILHTGKIYCLYLVLFLMIHPNAEKVILVGLTIILGAVCIQTFDSYATDTQLHVRIISGAEDVIHNSADDEKITITPLSHIKTLPALQEIIETGEQMVLSGVALTPFQQYFSLFMISPLGGGLQGLPGIFLWIATLVG